MAKNNKKTKFTKSGDTLKTEQTVYEKIVDEFGPDLKVVKGLAGGTGTSAHINFRCYSRIASMVTQMATKSPMIKSYSEVHRAAHYLGVQILFHILMKDNFDFKCGQTYEAINATEKVNYDYQILDDCAMAFAELRKSNFAGVIDKKTAMNHIEDVIDSVPSNLKNLARETSIKIFSGTPVKAILNDKGVGHPGGKNKNRRRIPEKT